MSELNTRQNAPDLATTTKSFLAAFKLDDWHFGDILFGGLIGMRIVDPATGAMWKIDTQYLNETLSPTGGKTAAEPPL